MKGLDGANHPKSFQKIAPTRKRKPALIAGSDNPRAGTSIWQDVQAVQRTNGVSAALIKELISQLPCD